MAATNAGHPPLKKRRVQYSVRASEIPKMTELGLPKPRSVISLKLTKRGRSTPSTVPVASQLIVGGRNVEVGMNAQSYQIEEQRVAPVIADDHRRRE